MTSYRTDISSPPPRMVCAFVLCGLLLFSACASERHPARYAAPSPDSIATKPENQGLAIDFPKSEDERFVHEMDALPQPPDSNQKAYSLSELVDVGLQLSPVTRQAWARAQAQAAAWARSRSDYYPTLDGNVQGQLGKIPMLQGGRSSLSTGVELQYLLLDFGDRSAKAEAARQALIAANWNQNQAIQDLLRDVPQAYYTHVGYQSQMRATKKSLEEAQTTLRATEARRQSGVATIADVLQARSRKDQVLVQLATDRGNVKISRGTLATVVGWPANTPLQTANHEEKLPLNALSSSVDALVEQAKQSRPDIESAKAQVRSAQAQFMQARAIPFPKLSVSGNLNWERLRNTDNFSSYGGLNLSIPIFHGFDMENAVRQARADLDAARETLRIQEETVFQEVWNAFQNFTTAKEKLSASRTLLVSAAESFQVSLGRYKTGAGDIVELLNAQATLADARSQVIDARMGVHTSYAELVHAVGAVLPDTPMAEASAPIIEEEDRTYGE